MGTTNHFPECWRQEDHPACRLRRIHELEVKVLALETQLQYERTGHLIPTGMSYPPSVLPHPLAVPVEIPPNRVTCGAIPCHDHIEPPIVSGGPTWASRNDEPPSFTP